jgi:hypothetical protein
MVPVEAPVAPGAGSGARGELDGPEVLHAAVVTS